MKPGIALIGGNNRIVRWCLSNMRLQVTAAVRTPDLAASAPEPRRSAVPGRLS